MVVVSGGVARGRRGGGGGFGVPRRSPVVVDHVGCGCRGARLLGSLLTSLASCALRWGGGGKPRSPHAPSSSSSAAAFSSSAGASSATTATTVSSAADSWGHGAAAYTTNTLYEDADEEGRRERRRRRRRQRQRQRRRTWRDQEEAAAATAAREEAEAVAVEVESTAPYEDFRESMAAMVAAKEMYAWEELNALLHRFLSLNSPRHHPLILHAFADLWAPRGGLFAPPSPCLGL